MRGACADEVPSSGTSGVSSGTAIDERRGSLLPPVLLMPETRRVPWMPEPRRALPNGGGAAGAANDEKLPRELRRGSRPPAGAAKDGAKEPRGDIGSKRVAEKKLFPTWRRVP